MSGFQRSWPPQLRSYIGMQCPSKTYTYIYPFVQKNAIFVPFQFMRLVVDLMEKYLMYLKTQIEESKTISLFSDKLDSLYIGGGTPSLYSPQALSTLLKSFDITKINEITIEVNASEVKKLQSYSQVGFNRFSIGIQTFNQQTLSLVNRFQHIGERSLYDELLTQFQHFRPIKLNFDFILDLSRQNIDYQQILSFIRIIKPQHLTIYMLEVNQGSYLHKHSEQFSWLLKEDGLLQQRYCMISEQLTSLGYDHYEVNHFALIVENQPQLNYSVHNQVYWEGDRQFAAYGMGATSLSNGYRFTRPKTLAKYCSFIEGQLGNEQHEVYVENMLSKRLESVIMSGLRTKKGLQWVKLFSFCDSDVALSLKEKIVSVALQIQIEKQGLICVSRLAAAIALTVPLGLLYADQIAYRFIQQL